jgi:hypothetical protein
MAALAAWLRAGACASYSERHFKTFLAQAAHDATKRAGGLIPRNEPAGLRKERQLNVSSLLLPNLERVIADAHAQEGAGDDLIDAVFRGAEDEA